MKILLWKIGALGDVLMTTPLIRQLRAAKPLASIDYLVGKSAAPVLQGNPNLSGIRIFDEEILYRRQISRLSSLREVLREYDIVLILDKHWIFPALAKWAGVKYRVGFERRCVDGYSLSKKIPYGMLRHEISYYLDLLAALGHPVNVIDNFLELHDFSVAPIEGPYTVLINSGGRNPYELTEVRNMPKLLFKSLADYFSEKGKVVFVGAEWESSKYDDLSIHGATNLCGLLSFPQLWDLLKRASAIYTTDCGLMHMAAAVNSNVTAIFGPTHPLRKCPPNAHFVWRDMSIYKDAYELYGKVPRGRYFSTTTLEEIIFHAQPMPSLL